MIEIKIDTDVNNTWIVIVNNGDWIMTFEHFVSKRKKEEKKRKERNERERAQMREMDFADTQIEEREREWLFLLV